MPKYTVVSSIIGIVNKIFKSRSHALVIYNIKL